MSHVSARPILFIVSGPSGAGKGTFLNHVAEHYPGVARITTYTTRDPRPGERADVDYHFVSPDRFTRLVDTGLIFEYTTPYGDYHYGSPQSLLTTSDERDAVVELDYRGMLRTRAQTMRRAVSIFLMPPADDVRLRRIQTRQEESNLSSRMDVTAEQVQFAWAYDYVLVNTDLSQFKIEVSAIMDAERLRRRSAQVVADTDTMLTKSADPESVKSGPLG